MHVSAGVDGSEANQARWWDGPAGSSWKIAKVALGGE
jgi:hypothetical protein